MVPKWFEKLIPLLTFGRVDPEKSLFDTTRLIEQAATYQLVAAGRLYKRGSDEILRLCIEPYEQDSYLSEAHVGLCG